MTNLEDQWKKWIEEHLTHEQTITNCIITAAFVSYCAPFERSTRIRICEFVAQCCLKHDIPKEPQKIFQVTIYYWPLFFPSTFTNIEICNNEESRFARIPLLVDPIERDRVASLANHWEYPGERMFSDRGPQLWELAAHLRLFAAIGRLAQDLS